MALREETMARKTVLIYKGLGANEIGCDQLKSALHSCLSVKKYDIDFISPEEIIEGTKLKASSLIAFGAGYLSGFATALGDKGMKNIKEHILSGSSYLGLGAGGYFGCDYIQFDKRRPVERMTERDLRFYPGVCCGPACPGFKHGTYKRPHPAHIDFTSEEYTDSFYTMIDGGGAFYPRLPRKPGSPVKTVVQLAKYSELPNQPAAIVKTTLKGKGTVILSGVHLEYNVVSLVESNPELQPLFDKFCSSSSSQSLAFKFMIKMLV